MLLLLLAHSSTLCSSDANGNMPYRLLVSNQLGTGTAVFLEPQSDPMQSTLNYAQWQDGCISHVDSLQATPGQ